MPTPVDVPEAFPRLAARFGEQLDAVVDLVDPALVRPDWAERNAELERALRPLPPADYLRHPSVLFQMGDPLEPAILAAGARPEPLGAFMPGQNYYLR